MAREMGFGATLQSSNFAHPCPLWVISCRDAHLVPCPLYPRKLPRQSQTGVSALGQIRTSPALFNYFIGGRQQRRRNG